MRVGIVSWWFNRGQATVGRQLRSACDALGHRTFVLARPNHPRAERPGLVSDEDVWRQEGVTRASHFWIPEAEYLDWVAKHGIEVVLLDQNFQFETIAGLRERGVRTIGRFVWEQIGDEDVARAAKAYDVVYSLTRCEQERYRRLGLASPFVRWGCHPEVVGEAAGGPRRSDATWFFYPAGYLTRRKPVGTVLRAFSAVPRDDVRLLVKSQVPLRRRQLEWPTRRRRLARRLLGPGARFVPKDPRIVLVHDDLDQAAYHALFSSCHVCLAPSRWEGLGLHLFEATGFGMPIITNDSPPMNEWVHHGRNGLLVPDRHIGHPPSGISAREPDARALRDAIEELADPAVRERLGRGAEEMRRELDWAHTVEDVGRLLAR